MSKKNSGKTYDLVCIGGGIMSMTHALLLKILNPACKILILERLSETGQESSKTMNNAGTGHAGNCELNYTKIKEDGSLDISKALEVCHDFELTMQFWSYLTEEGFLSDSDAFVFPTYHCSWVHDEEQVRLLKKRYETMKAHVEFENMEYTEDFNSMREWFPLIMKHRTDDEHLAGTRIKHGTEIDFEAVTQSFMNILKNEFEVDILVDHDVEDVNRITQGWTVEGKISSDEKSFSFETEKIFIGAGGGALLLLQKSEIEEHEHYGGFPVSGKWLVCQNEELIQKHEAQVYSKASGNNPPMSAPHLDSRHIDGKKALLFGPFAGFSTKFLKKGSSLDLPHSVNFENIPTYWGVFWKNLNLTRYLVEQVVTGKDAQMEELRKFIKEAKSEDWEMQTAGQRVQILKKSKEEGALLEFGTEVVSNTDGTVTALLGASPGASTAVKIALDIIKQEYPDLLNSDEVKTKLDSMIPFWNKPVEGNEDEFRKIREQCLEKLGLAVTT
ncbi:malate:quinone oxidoreductase [Psychroflexus sediminis]|uniref:Probable malate:quinone oxidoreductase n=1 Tax=Psychroflexus sediminis TaxID=470826 RepID=A0A1G7WA97_9FLAO|nr:malate:quinone oxidoreductase [Psychroflexus sediminis]SDG68000.1 malate dehydrogenase (quinone) [Psychroflexus sediminis]